MYSYLLKRCVIILLTISLIMVAGFAILRLMPGDQLALQQSGYAANRKLTANETGKYETAYYENGFHLPVFYLGLTTLAVPDSFYHLPGKDFQYAAVRLSLQSGQPLAVYTALKQDPVLSWKSAFSRNEITVAKLAAFYSHAAAGASWKEIENNSASWKKWIPVISLHTDNQFHRWLFGKGDSKGVLAGNFGVSPFTGRDVWDELKRPMMITAIIAILSLLLSVILSIAISFWLSRKGRFFRVNIVSPLFLALYSLPVFWIGTWFLYLFANPYGLQLFPASGYYGSEAENSWLFYTWLLLPIFCNSFSAILFLTRLLTEGFADEDKTDYTRTALAKGVSLSSVRKKHQLRNLVFPALAVIAGSFPAMMNGSVLIEQIFSIPGLGNLMIRAVATRDVPLLSGFFLVTGILTILVFQFIDLMGRLTDPRVRFDSDRSTTQAS